jgi:hypothetical protein
MLDGIIVVSLTWKITFIITSGASDGGLLPAMGSTSVDKTTFWYRELSTLELFYISITAHHASINCFSQFA